MHRPYLVIAVLLNCLLCIASFGQTVVIYEQKNFSGRSETLAVGDHRLADWKPASIQVSAGLVAYLYESVNSAGAYGISVDLMENHPDLSEFGLNGNVSFISVFSSTRPDGFFWARNSMRGGQFVAGHWERNRAGGNPVDTVAVASSPLPDKTPPAPTSIQQQGATWTITALGPQSPGDAAQWSRADPTMGVVGSDFRGPQEIGSAAVERASNNIAIPDWLNFWYPNKQRNDHRSLVYFKRTLTGAIADTIARDWTGLEPDGRGGTRKISGSYGLSDAPHIADISGTYPDHDLNIDVTPFVNYMYLINDSHKPERSTEVEMKDLVDSDNDPCIDPFFVVEAEVQSGNVAMKDIATSLQGRVGKQVAMYGPWIYDVGHCDHPEIHPAEEIWWAENIADSGQLYHLNVFADSSTRFWWRSQMDDGTKLHPWGAPPIVGLFAIAFEVPIETHFSTVGGIRFEVTNVDQWNVAPVPGSNTAHDLVFGGRTLVSFVPHNDAFKVSYENVGLKPGTTNIVRGFLVIETTVGIVKQIATTAKYFDGSQFVSVNIPEGVDPDKIDQRFETQIFHKEEGHYMFTVTRTEMNRVVVKSHKAVMKSHKLGGKPPTTNR